MQEVNILFKTDEIADQILKLLKEQDSEGEYGVGFPISDIDGYTPVCKVEKEIKIASKTAYLCESFTLDDVATIVRKYMIDENYDLKSVKPIIVGDKEEYCSFAGMKVVCTPKKEDSFLKKVL